MIAPGHIYSRVLGDGIEWLPGKVKLWLNGRVWAEAPHDATSAYEFFYNLGFVLSFPDVTHWWFRSNWNGRVKISSALGLLDGETVYGYIQFDTDEVAQFAKMWTVSDGTPVQVAVPFPLGQVQPANLPLRLSLAQKVLAVISGQQPPDEWLPVSSLVKRDASVEGDLPTLEQAFPLHYNDNACSLPIRVTALASDDPGGMTPVMRRWNFADTPDLAMRNLLCEMQGLTRPEAISSSANMLA